TELNTKCCRSFKEHYHFSKTEETDTFASMKAIYNHIIFTGLVGLLTVNAALAQNEAPVQTQNSANAKITDLAPTPPMGWNSWNTFQTRIDEKLLRDMVDAFVASGM